MGDCMPLGGARALDAPHVGAKRWVPRRAPFDPSQRMQDGCMIAAREESTDPGQRPIRRVSHTPYRLVTRRDDRLETLTAKDIVD
jgi:hypothetical protein